MQQGRIKRGTCEQPLYSMILPVGERKKSFHPQDTDSPFINRYSLDSVIPVLYPAEPSSLFYYLPIIAHPAHSCPCRLVFQMQIWTAALDSVALKCISCKILPFCERVIFRKKRRQELLRQPVQASVKPERSRQREPNRGKKKQIIKNSRQWKKTLEKAESTSSPKSGKWQ